MKKILVLFLLIISACSFMEQRAPEDIVYDEIVLRMDTKGEDLAAQVLGINKLMASALYRSTDREISAKTEKNAKDIIKKAIADTDITTTTARKWLETETGKNIEISVQGLIISDMFKKRVKDVDFKTLLGS